MEKDGTFTAWFKNLVGEDTQKEVAKKAGLIESTLSRQLSRGTFRPEMVIALCRGYGRSPVTGLIETGYLQEWEAENVGIPYALHNATNQQILDEILRRSDPEAAYLFGDPTGEAVDYKPTEPEPDPNPQRAEEKSAPALHAVKEEESDVPYTDDDIDHDEIIRQINAGEIQVAAQKATEPLEEHWP